MKKLSLLLAFAATFTACKKDDHVLVIEPLPTTDFREKFVGTYAVKIDWYSSIHRSSGGSSQSSSSSTSTDTVNVSYNVTDSALLFMAKKNKGPAITINSQTGNRYGVAAINEEGYISEMRNYSGSILGNSINISFVEEFVSTTRMWTMRGTRIK